ncbi:hypothetical protein LMTR13_24950 [Bradyrhizobium icense]|uniref:Uncharacterized protein n=1 Tax=Bradyrhizobium icense TaxID=1274631 RepID=A0A1B1UJK9_9BRAD|nr:hypothetical protein LMTR13_24950 [Bradyrhizobium icense]
MVILALGEHAGHSPKGKIGGDHDEGALVQRADEMEKELTAGLLGRGQISEFRRTGCTIQPILGKTPAFTRGGRNAASFTAAIEEMDDTEAVNL